MRERLRRAGVRPIHPIVDVTNYVMLELGQPLHAYDLAKLDRTHRSASRPRERDRSRCSTATPSTLTDDMLVIADARGPVGLAGVMGGKSTAVSDATDSVFLESAFFAPAAIVGRARRIGLHTDASLRFERGVDPSRASARHRARDRAVARRSAAGRPARSRTSSAAPICRSVRLSRCAASDCAPCSVSRCRPRMWPRSSRASRCRWRTTGGRLARHAAVVPVRRRDRGGSDRGGRPHVRLRRNTRDARRRGRAAGHSPPSAAWRPTALRICSSRAATPRRSRTASSTRRSRQLVNPGAATVELANPISSDMAVLRRSLWPGLINAARLNVAHQRQRLRLFEIGPQFEAAEQGVAQTAVVAGLALGTRAAEHWEGAWRRRRLLRRQRRRRSAAASHGARRRVSLRAGVRILR